MYECAFVCYGDLDRELARICDPEQHAPTRSGGLHSDKVSCHARHVGPIDYSFNSEINPYEYE
jgi:hypothetical protein